jgi:hypothetical protein
MPKGKVYVKNSHSLEDLEGNNKHVMSTIPVQQLRCVSRNMFSKCEACLEAEGCYSHIK